MREDLWRFTGLSVVAGLTGLMLDQVTLCLWIATLGYALWQHRKLRRLFAWLQRRKAFDAPEARGAIGAICREIDFMRERHKKRKKKLSGFLKQFQDATTALPDAAVVLGPDGEIQWVNAAAADYLGIRWPQDLRQRLANLVRHPAISKVLKKKNRKASTVEIPSPVKRDAYLSITVVPMGKDQRLVVARDVTRLHRLIQIRSDFVANVSHELRTPVTVIKGYLEALNADREGCPERWVPVLEELDAQADRMGKVIDELLLLSKLEQEDRVAQPEVVLVSDILGSIYKEARALSGDARHLYYLEIDQDLWIMGSHGELYSAFSNLVVNAVRYTPAGGVIRIRWYRDGTGAHMEVKDTGIGIPEPHITRLTERFYRVDPSRSRESGGTGLGLAIVKHVLKRHNAKLHIDSTVGKGSTFRCDFPLDLIVAAEVDVELDHPPGLSGHHDPDKSSSSTS